MSNRIPEKRESARMRLEREGADVEFLQWLEGKEDRLPRLGPLKEISGAQLAGAIRGAAWLRGAGLSREAISDVEWDRRYLLLEGFLLTALKVSRLLSARQVAEDLADLEDTMQALLPASAQEPYRHDILSLRKAGKPIQLPPSKSPRRGGSPESEETTRMRVAISYLAPLTRTPYQDLAELWNESNPLREYDSDAIRQRLRKGSPSLRNSASEACRVWRGIYHLEPSTFMQIFPGPFPPSKEIRKIWEQRAPSVRTNQPFEPGGC